MRKRASAQITWSVAAALAGALGAPPAGSAEVEKPAQTPAPTSVPESPNESEIKAAEAIIDLTDPSVDVRERATRRLLEMGHAAESVLRRAAESADPEVSARAREILLDFQYALYPETPADIASLIRSYRRGGGNEKRGVIRALQKLGRRGSAILVRLAAVEQDVALSADIRRELSARPADAVAAFIAEDNHAGAEQILDGWWPASADGAQSYAAYWLMRGKIDEKIAQHRKPLDAMGAGAAVDNARGPGLAGLVAPQARLLVHLYRAKGDLDGALWAAEQTGDRDILENILLLRRDWKTLAARIDRELAGPHIERLGFLAAYQRLGGDRQGLAKTIERIQSVQAPRESDVWHVAEALLLNGQVEDGIRRLEEGGRPSSAFKLLVARREYDRAFALAEKVKGAGSEDMLIRAHLGRTLHLLGERKKARQVLDSMRDDLKRLRDSGLWQEAIEAEVVVGERDLSHAIERTAEALAHLGGREPMQKMIDKLFPRRGDEGFAWVIYFQVKEDGGPAAGRVFGPVRAGMGTILKQAAEVMDRAHAGRDAAKDAAALDALGADVVAVARRMGSAGREEMLRGAGQTLAAAGRDEAAANCWKLLTGFTDAQSDHLLLADQAARKEDWARAAELYAVAVEKDRGRAYPRYMRGHALTKLGREEEGRRMMAAATLMPLAEEAERSLMARGLSEMGLEDAADAQNEMVLKTGDFEYWLGDAQRRLAWKLNEKGEYAEAAVLWEKALLDVLHTNTTFLEEATYLATPGLIHKTRAMALAKSGKADDALAAAEAALRHMPGDLNVAIELVPALERGGHAAEAKTLLDREVKVLSALCERWPSSATHHNSMAWLLARVRKDLDRAMMHATKAAELDPESCAILDTLAEVHFQRGDKAKAIEIIKACIELEPRVERHRQALKRFETQGPETPPPAE